MCQGVGWDSDGLQADWFREIQENKEVKTLQDFSSESNMAELQKPVLDQFAVQLRSAGWGQILKFSAFCRDARMVRIL
jgi:hypothetical protein